MLEHVVVLVLAVHHIKIAALCCGFGYAVSKAERHTRIRNATSIGASATDECLVALGALVA